MDDGGTYLEDFLQSVELLPNDIRRDFELMRELDKDAFEANTELLKLEDAYLKKYQVKGGETVNRKESEEALNNISSLRQKVKQKLAQKAAIALNMNSIIDNFTRKLDTDIAFFETDLRGCGEFPTNNGIEPGSDVAIRPVHTEYEWILGRVISFHADIGAYDITDIDDAEKKSLRLPEHQVVALNMCNDSLRNKLSKGEEVLAVYPDTSTFYHATVVYAPRRYTAASASMISLGMAVEVIPNADGNGSVPTVIVQFQGDADEATGQTPARTIPLKHVIRKPPL